jgi:HAD superfamily hydrolase (TIGR01549 family)
MAASDGTGVDARGGSVMNPLEPGRRIKAVLFDLDGTLYHQPRMRALMALELSTMIVTKPWSARRRLKALSAYRRAQESLRESTDARVSPGAQIEFASTRSGMLASEVGALVEEWMFERPLKYMRMCSAEGLSPLLALLERARVPIGVLSDYPAEAKLRALGLAGRFSPVLCSTDPEIAALKPHPRGFLRASEHWRVDPAEVLVVGDRADVDGGGARAAGMPCVVIGSPASGVRESGVMFLPSLERLRCVLDAGR